MKICYKEFGSGSEAQRNAPAISIVFLYQN